MEDVHVRDVFFYGCKLSLCVPVTVTSHVNRVFSLSLCPPPANITTIIILLYVFP